MITESNLKMAERLLAKESFFDHRAMRRSIDHYEQLKKSMTNNRRALCNSTVIKPSLPVLTVLSRKKEASSGAKNKVALNYEEELYDPE
jgi:hypothetical protein